MKRECTTSRMTVNELVGLLDTMSPSERQAATTEMEPLRQIELVSVPEPIAPVPLANGSTDIRSAPVAMNTVTRRTAHMPLSMRRPALPGTPMPTNPPPVPTKPPPMPTKPLSRDLPIAFETELSLDDVILDRWAADEVLLFGSCLWSVIASAALFVVALV